MTYLKHLDKSLRVFNLNIIVEWSIFGGRGLDETEEKTNVKMVQL